MVKPPAFEPAEHFFDYVTLTMAGAVMLDQCFSVGF